MTLHEVLKLPMIGVYRENSKHAMTLDSWCGSSLVYLELKSLMSSISLTTLKNKSEIINYLNSGTMMLSMQLEEYDCFTHDLIDTSCSMLTDGVYRWMSSLSYYVDQYNLVLPKDFVSRALSHNTITYSEKVE